jgi:hypothetical protein
MLRKCLDGDNNYAELVSPYSNKNTWKTPCRCSIINEFSRKSSSSQSADEPNSNNNNNDHRKLFCHNDFFNYMNSRKVLSMKSLELKLSKLSTTTNSFTSIATLNNNNNDNDDTIVLILSTLNARILMLKHHMLTNTATQYDEVNLVNALKENYALEHVSLNAQAQFISASNINLAVLDTTSANKIKRALFVAYDRFLFKIDLQNCEQFTTCETCLGIRENQQVSNPFCGWCVYEQKCMLKQTCSRKTMIGG